MSATMDSAIAIRSVAYVAFIGVHLAVATTLDDQRYPATLAWKTKLSPSVTALDAELGAQAANDIVCKAEWKANRHCFLQSNALRPATENVGQPK
jgi:hypothetical protein